MTFKPIEELTLADNFMFWRRWTFFYIVRVYTCATSFVETTKLEARVLFIIGIKETGDPCYERIVYPELEKELTAYYESKSVRLDVYVKDSDKVYDIEMQNQPSNFLPLRTRYYQSMIDVDNLLKGEDYSNLKESFIIFICTFDPFNNALPCYTFKSICKENTNIELNDKTSKIIFNSTAYDKEKDVEISAFLKYIKTQEATDDFTNRLKTFVEKAKHNKELRSYYLSMNIHDSDIRRVAFQEGEKQGAEQKAIETAKNLLTMNLSLEQIAQATSLPLKKIQELEKETIQN